MVGRRVVSSFILILIYAVLTDPSANMIFIAIAAKRYF